MFVKFIKIFCQWDSSFFRRRHIRHPNQLLSYQVKPEACTVLKYLRLHQSLLACACLSISSTAFGCHIREVSKSHNFLLFNKLSTTAVNIAYQDSETGTTAPRATNIEDRTIHLHLLIPSIPQRFIDRMPSPFSPPADSIMQVQKHKIASTVLMCHLSEAGFA